MMSFLYNTKGVINISYRKYIYGVAFICSVIVICISLFNFCIDPYGIWDGPRFNRINEFIYNIGHERLYKMHECAKNKKIDTLFLGSSTVKKALYPRTYSDLTGLVAYNSGFDAARILEMKYILEQTILYHPELSEVILCLNFIQFEQSFEGLADSFPSYQLGHRLPVIKEAFPRLLSKIAAVDSIGTLRKNYNHILHCSLFDEDGKMNPYWLRKEYEKSKTDEEFCMDTIAQIPVFKKFRMSTKTREDYAEIVKICKEHNIKLSVYINPVHSIFLESIYQAGSGEIFQDWKKWLATIHPIYDFAHYSIIGNEPFSMQRQYWRNTQHPMPSTGDIVLRKLTGKELPEDVGDFGFLLTENNVEEVLEMERRNREIWRENNPETVQFVQDLVKRY